MAPGEGQVGGDEGALMGGGRTAAGELRASRPLVGPVLWVPLVLCAVLAATVVAVLGVLFAGDGEPGAVDERIWAAVEGVGEPWRRFALAVDFLGEPGGAVPLIGAAVLGCLVVRRPRAAVLVVAGTGTSVVAATLLKHVSGRTIHGAGNLSYPSGHTAFLTALALTVALLAASRLGLGRAAGTALVLGSALAAGALMGWAQVVLGAHYPTDVLGGCCTALAATPATAWAVDRTAARLPDRTPDTGPHHPR